jgi:hypothetical protein
MLYGRCSSEESLILIFVSCSNGAIIEDYPDDVPYPCCLISGTVNDRPLHVVMAYNNVDSEAIVITAYEPDPDTWSENNTRRRS